MPNSSSSRPIGSTSALLLPAVPDAKQAEVKPLSITLGIDFRGKSLEPGHLRILAAIRSLRSMSSVGTLLGLHRKTIWRQIKNLNERFDRPLIGSTRGHAGGIWLEPLGLAILDFYQDLSARPPPREAATEPVPSHAKPDLALGILPKITPSRRIGGRGRDNVVSGALQLFALKGTGVSLREISDACDVSAPTVLKYFKRKEAIAYSLFVEQYQLLLTALEDQSGDDRLFAFLELLTRHVERSPAALCYVLGQRQFFETALPQWLQGRLLEGRLVSALCAEQRRGVLDISLPWDFATLVIFGTLEQAARSAVLGRRLEPGPLLERLYAILK